MRDPLILAKRLKTIDALHHAAFCVITSWRRCQRAQTRERKRLEKAIKTLKAGAKHHGDRLLQ